MYAKSTNYVPDEIHPESELFLLLQNPGADEERWGIPACGKTGQLLNETFIPLAGLRRGAHVSVGNVIRCRLGHTNDLPDDDTRRLAAEHCQAAYFEVPASTKLIVTQGQLALDYARTILQPSTAALTGGVTAWRGFFVSDARSHVDTSARGRSAPVFATVHTADTFRDSAMLWVSKLDWRHIGDILHGGWSGNTSPRQYVTLPGTLRGDAADLWERLDSSTPSSLVVDTEYIAGTTVLTTIGVGIESDQGGRSAGRAGTCGALEHESGSSPELLPFSVLSISWSGLTVEDKRNYRERLRDLVRRADRVIFHNAIADLEVLEANGVFTLQDIRQVEDTMLAHAILWSELPHTLDFLASVYGQQRKFKALWGVDELVYNYGDVVDTYYAWQSLVRGFETDREAEKVYREQSLALLPVLLRARTQGIRVNTARVLEVFEDYRDTLEKVKAYAELAVGYPLNLNSGQQLKSYLYTERGYPLQVNKDTKRATSNDDAIARLRNALGPVFDSSRELTFALDDPLHYSVVGRVAAGADPILESRALWASGWQVVNNYIIGLAKGVYNGETEAQRKKARALCWREGLRAGSLVHRVYPNFSIHAQKTGRWSTTEPPLAQLPADLRDIVCPDEGEVCISWDWSAIEPRVLQALTRSTLLKRTFDEGLDIHTWTVCYMFGYDMPPDLVDPHKSASCEAWRGKYNWRGSDDPRRVFAKQARYEMWYGGSGSNAAQAAAQFGLNAADLRVALSKLATSDPAYYTWKVQTEAEVKRTSLIRTFMGRPRRFLSRGDAQRREGLNQPMQGAVSDIFNTTVVSLDQHYPYLRWGWGMHDSQKWYVKRETLTPERFEAIRQIVERTHRIGGQETPFPAKFEIITPPEQGNLKLTPSQYFALAA